MRPLVSTRKPTVKNPWSTPKNPMISLTSSNQLDVDCWCWQRLKIFQSWSLSLLQWSIFFSWLTAASRNLRHTGLMWLCCCSDVNWALVLTVIPHVKHLSDPLGHCAVMKKVFKSHVHIKAKSETCSTSFTRISVFTLESGTCSEDNHAVLGLVCVGWGRRQNCGAHIF